MMASKKSRPSRQNLAARTATKTVKRGATEKEAREGKRFRKSTCLPFFPSVVFDQEESDQKAVVLNSFRPIPLDLSLFIPSPLKRYPFYKIAKAIISPSTHRLHLPAPSEVLYLPPFLGSSSNFLQDRTKESYNATYVQ